MNLITSYGCHTVCEHRGRRNLHLSKWKNKTCLIKSKHPACTDVCSAKYQAEYQK